ncbi:MAG: hypothetical protein R2769_14840 [Saprospiraceae bacterium]
MYHFWWRDRRNHGNGRDLTLNGTYSLAGNFVGNYKDGDDARPTGLIIGGKVFFNSGNGINLLNNSYVKLGNTNGVTVYDTDNNGATVNTQLTSGNYNASPRFNWLQIKK